MRTRLYIDTFLMAPWWEVYLLTVAIALPTCMWVGDFCDTSIGEAPSGQIWAKGYHQPVQNNIFMVSVGTPFAVSLDLSPKAWG